MTKTDDTIKLKQLGWFRKVEVVEGVKIGPMSVKCRCGWYRSVKIRDNKFMAEGCKMHDKPYHIESMWEQRGTGKEFDIEDEIEMGDQTQEF